MKCFEIGDGAVVRLVDCLPGNGKALGSIPRIMQNEEWWNTSVIPALET